MTGRQFLRVYWTFIWRFVLVNYGVSLVSALWLMPILLANLPPSVGVIGRIGFHFVASLLVVAYALNAVFQAGYRRFEIDVRTDKPVDAF